MRRALVLVAGAVSVLAWAHQARADLQADATITSSAAGGGYHYDLTLHNSGDTTVGTFWYAWVPGAEFLPSMPTAVMSPAGWSALLTHAGAGDGYGIEWTASTLLPAGSSLSGFGFDSPDAPAAVNGNAALFPFPPVGTSYVYSGGAFSDAGYQFVVMPAAVPEPASLGLLAAGAALVLRRRPRGRAG